jgi:hypothetical protein
MKTIGKILLFIGALLFFISGIVSIVGLVTAGIADPKAMFADASHIGAFIILVLWIVLDIFAGLYGMMYAVSGKHHTFVGVISWLILILFVIDVVTTLVSSIQSKTWVWTNSWDSVVYGGVSGALYCIGYFLDRKKH